MSESLPLSDLIPTFISTIRTLVSCQHGMVSVPCPLAYYKKASGQV